MQSNICMENQIGYNDQWIYSFAQMIDNFFSIFQGQ